MRALVTLVLLVALAQAEPKPAAKQHMDAAAVAYKAGRFADTLAELEAAFAIDPRPELHYSIGQVYVKLDRCTDAIAAYERFLASRPSPDRAELANQAIEVCRLQLAAQPPPPPAPAPMPPPPPPPARRAVDVAPAWYKDKLGLALVGGGAVAGVVAVVLYADARSTTDDAASASDYAESQRLYDDAKRQRTTSIVVGAVGVAALGIGTWRLLAKRSAEQSRVMAVVPFASGGGVVTLSGRF